ncbi:MAG: diguanylate cyclase [Oscillospiraceae bacterium]|nr:diguanylate cyclase [Oscillospiraceae bacterium]
MGEKKSSKKAYLDNFLGCMGSILDPQGLEVVAVRGKKCDIIFASSKAEARMALDPDAARGCKSNFSKSMPELCEHCPYGEKDEKAEIKPFEIEDSSGRTYAGGCHMVDWVDGKPAAIFVLRDITEEKEVKNRLYELAYIDHLTGVPNRQKLKEDFAEVEEKIAKNKLTGVAALFDLDHFKAVNDTYGHNTGDVVLRRLTEHLQADKAFNGHLYRLGGDEFVLLFSAPPGKFASEAEMLQQYQSLLSTALQSYTLPNIDLSCTLSMGVSVFPKHGDTLSEILRKADIALYKAKAAGRNQMVFFEDRYDVAQKFKDLYINIQPVLLGSGKTFAYELTDRGSGGEEDEGAVSLSEFNRALDALGLGDINNDMLYFIWYSKQLLNPAVLGNLPKNKFIILLNLPGQVTANDLQIYIALKKKGYKLALAGLSSSKATPELLKLADYCKFSVADTNPAMLKKVISASPNVRFIATRVDSPGVFQEAKAAGFHLYQGFFFNQPAEMRKTKELGPMKVNYFRLLKLSSTDDYMDFREISEIIASDVALTYKLLRILNSAAVGLRNVSNIAMAVAYIGEESLKKWIAVLALRGIADDQPLELVRMSLVRARFGETLAPYFRIKRNPKQVFMVGMLSLLHIALDKSKEELLAEIPVSEDIRQSLMTKNGVYSDLLRFYEHFEYANWEEVTQFAKDHQLDPQFVNDTYIAAVKWYNDLTRT